MLIFNTLCFLCPYVFPKTYVPMCFPKKKRDGHLALNKRFKPLFSKNTFRFWNVDFGFRNVLIFNCL
jgi:hypothetical protein